MPTRKLTYVPASVKGNIVNTNVDKADSSEATEISACRKKGRAGWELHSLWSKAGFRAVLYGPGVYPNRSGRLSGVQPGDKHRNNQSALFPVAPRCLSANYAVTHCRQRDRVS
jgi:hypothetical protein